MCNWPLPWIESRRWRPSIRLAQKQPFAAVLSGDMKNHHTDGQREFAYDRDSAIGRLDKALQEAPERGWQVVRIQNDWRTVFPDPR